ncbi:acetyl-CoA carboxylase biotin carboxyl carrier protein [Microtetraspora glauca]|uniref:Biotin carboxyl carrier protein of acetyl-CoA carboxylase n=1 Tax=Microtetraspora glauca TaxID=1996 RepID=A0ABV3G8C4_MICGL
MTETLPSASPDAGPLDPVPDTWIATEISTVWRTVVDMVGGASRPPSRISVQLGSASIEMEWGASPEATVGVSEAPAVRAAVPGAPAPEPEPQVWHAVRAPLVGTFYRAPEPGAKPFVEVGDIVEPGRQIGIVEAMKLMNPIVADTAGRIVEIPVGDGEPVEYDQPLLLLEPWEGE